MKQAENKDTLSLIREQTEASPSVGFRNPSQNIENGLWFSLIFDSLKNYDNLPVFSLVTLLTIGKGVFRHNLE